MTDRLTAEDVFYELSTIRDPERPDCTLADLDVVAMNRCRVEYIESSADFQSLRGQGCNDSGKPSVVVKVILQPTVPHCSLMEFICLCVYVRLREVFSLSNNAKFDITLVDGSHVRQRELEKQVADKERLAAAMEDKALLQEVERHINCE
ncbi:uncharacterized protein TEOVI_000181200 [Trypanosoma equiperdum]|uniref:MIP18 family-like domain-containing protein n=3 Tax=Trypanozoon TaxID=39700 RepID=Q38DX6_TRYB2|nr:hypothetical protein, conserved [Trypanosoma brucei brucei TREU927]EAN76994.1 hypothetical protein, conserved [Trypanosoma brucei brucei TREU927]RHW70507.1 hypothetical protein DPX39_090058800 [Trypanosoma brucei equiperdum]SCU70239.1 hypothetical protein, conserved [Trypanosoma equiperdum]